MRLRIMFCFVCLAALLPYSAHAQFEDDTLTYTISEEDTAGVESFDDYEDYYQEEERLINTTRPRQEYYNDTIPVEQFDRAEWEKITKGATFKEVEEEASKGPDISSMPFAIGSQFLKILMIGVLVLVVVYVLYMLLKDMKWTSKKTADEVTDIITAADELPEKDALWQLLKEALAKGNYKLAIRYYYLLLMAHYRQQGLIVWKKDKTNRHYLKEMRNHSAYNEIREATNLFERCWYGDVEPNSGHFIQAELLFNRLLQN